MVLAAKAADYSSNVAEYGVNHSYVVRIATGIVSTCDLTQPAPREKLVRNKSSSVKNAAKESLHHKKTPLLFTSFF